MRRSLRALGPLLFCCVVGTVGACDPAPLPDVGDVGPAPDAPLDGPLPDGGFVGCEDDTDCDDGVYCNGSERCRPGDPDADPLGCVASPAPCLAGQTCMEVGDRCVTVCADGGDADRDGVLAMECGGFDCDDSDRQRRPGLTEVCDDAGHDEDCDDTTFGTRDADGDGAVDALCCNGPICGTDCNDARGTSRPGGTEVCDGLDQDCDGMIDEGTLAPGYPDVDRDLHGDSSGAMRMACSGATGLAPVADDCDDANPAVHAAQPEIRDAIDNDCDTRVDEDVQAVTWYRDGDADGFGSAASGTTRSDAPVAGHSILGSDCDDMAMAIRPSATEQCNGLDDDCSGAADFAIAPGDLEDDDRDGELDAMCSGGTDCNDFDATTYTGAVELCDSRDNDCDGMADDGTGELTWYLDRDRDGAGDDRSPAVYTCELVTGRVLLGGDCDDDHPGRRPLALDACLAAGVDDDCDGRVDEDGALLPSYRDGDGDGVGAGAVTLACSAGTGSSGRSDDCDDADVRRAPGLAEVCTGGVDEDCDGTVDCEDPGCTASADCSIVYALSVADGADQTARIASELADRVVLRLRDGATPVVGREIRLRPPAGAHVEPASALTDAMGEVSFRVWVGRAPGAYAFIATATGAASVMVTATATAPTAGTVHTIVDRDGTPSALAAEGPGVVARPAGIDAIAVAADQTLYLADAAAHAVYALSPAGELTRVAGDGTAGSGGDGGPARTARLRTPTSLALDSTRGRLYVADADDHRVRVIDLATGVIDTYAGDGRSATVSVAGLPARLASMPSPRALELRGSGLAIVLDDARVLEVDGGTELVRELFSRPLPAGTRFCERGCDAFSIPGGDLLVSGRVLEYCFGMAEPVYGVLRIGSTDAQVIAGNCMGPTTDGSSARVFQVNRVASLAVEPSGDLLMADVDRLLRVAARTQRVTRLMGTLGGGGSTAEDVPAGSAAFSGRAIATSGSTLYFADGPRVRSIAGFLRSTTEPVTLTAAATLPSPAILDEVTGTVRATDGAGGLNQVLLDFEAATPGMYLLFGTVLVTNRDGDATGFVRLGRRVGNQRVRVSMRDVHGRAAATPADLVYAPLAPTGSSIRIWNAGRAVDDDTSLVSTTLTGVPGPASVAYGGPVRGLAMASDGTVYFSVSGRVISVDPDGVARVVAGGGAQSDPGMDVPATAWRFVELDSLALDEPRQLLYAMILDRRADVPGVFAIDLAAGRVRHLYESSGPRPSRLGASYRAAPVGTRHLYFDGATLRAGWTTVDPATGALTAGPASPTDAGSCGPAAVQWNFGAGLGGYGVRADGVPLLLAVGSAGLGACTCGPSFGGFLAEPAGTGLTPRLGGCTFAPTTTSPFELGAVISGEITFVDELAFAWAPLATDRILVSRYDGSCLTVLEVDVGAGTVAARNPADPSCSVGFSIGFSLDVGDHQILAAGPGGEALTTDFIVSSNPFSSGYSGSVAIIE